MKAIVICATVLIATGRLTAQTKEDFIQILKLITNQFIIDSSTLNQSGNYKQPVIIPSETTAWKAGDIRNFLFPVQLPGSSNPDTSGFMNILLKLPTVNLVNLMSSQPGIIMRKSQTQYEPHDDSLKRYQKISITTPWFKTSKLCLICVTGFDWQASYWLYKEKDMWQIFGYAGGYIQ